MEGKKETKLHKTTVGIIGGGAAGMMAAISAAREGADVLLLDANDKLGKKIYATGNGRCNLTNDLMEESCYNEEGRKLLNAVFAQYDRDDLLAFFQELGVLFHTRNGYYYPRTDQARTIVYALEREIQAQKSIRVLPKAQVRSIEPWAPLQNAHAIKSNDERAAKGSKGSSDAGSLQYRIYTDRESLTVDRVILTTGGMVSKEFGCKGDGYQMARSLGHTIHQPVPSLVNLMTDDPYIGLASGVRCQGSVSIMVDGHMMAQAEGELQFTDNGISGIPVFQVSRYAARALANGQEVTAGINFIRDLTPTEWTAEENRRADDPRCIYVSDIFEGIVPKGIGSFLARRKGLADEKKLANLGSRHHTVMHLMEDLGGIPIHITGTGDFKRAQVTAGGLVTEEVTDQLESRKLQGLYFAGEILDVDGICGGYNLTFAMCSGFVAGRAAAT